MQWFCWLAMGNYQTILTFHFNVVQMSESVMSKNVVLPLYHLCFFLMTTFMSWQSNISYVDIYFVCVKFRTKSKNIVSSISFDAPVPKYFRNQAARQFSNFKLTWKLTFQVLDSYKMSHLFSSLGLILTLSKKRMCVKLD